MNKSLALLTLGALLLSAPAVNAQVLPAHTLDASIEGLPTSSSINGTTMALPFTIQVSVSGNSPCVATGGSSYTFNVVAELLNSTGNNTTVTVSPASFTVSGPNTAPSTASRSSSATLLINPGPYAGDNVTAQVRVTVSSPGGNPGCSGASATAPVEVSADVNATFLPPLGYGASTPGAAMPALPMPLLLVVLAAALIVLRRR